MTIGAAAILQRRHDIDRKTVLFTFGYKKVGRTRAFGAEMEVEADRRPAYREAFDQDAADEFIGGKPCQRGVECEHDRAVEAARGEEPQFRGFVGQPEQAVRRD